MKLLYPQDVSVDDNYLFISDSKQNKIFVWEGGIPETVMSPRFAIDAPNPCQISSDGEHLAVACCSGHAILLWNLPLDEDDLSPDVELKYMEKDGTEIRFNLPTGVAVDGEHLFVADTGFHRVLIWNEVPTSSDTPPDIVLGQENFDLEDAYPHTTRDGLFRPGYIYFDGSYLWVTETKFSERLVRFKIEK